MERSELGNILICTAPPGLYAMVNSMAKPSNADGERKTDWGEIAHALPISHISFSPPAGDSPASYLISGRYGMAGDSVYEREIAILDGIYAHEDALEWNPKAVRIQAEPRFELENIYVK